MNLRLLSEDGNLPSQFPFEDDHGDEKTEDCYEMNH